MDRNTKLTLSTDMYSIPTIMRNMIIEGKTKLVALTIFFDDIENMVDNGDYEACAAAVSRLREKLFEIDSKYEDLTTLMLSYTETVQKLQQQGQEEEQEQGEEIGN